MKTLPRTYALALTACLLATPALAAPDDAPERDPRVAAILDQMPTESEMRAIADEMPDFNNLASGLMDIAQDEDTHATLERVGKRLETRLDAMALELEAEDGELPDFNGLVEEMMVIASDKESMGDLLGLMFQVVDVVEASVEEDTPNP